MRDQYLVSPEKTALAVTIANRERDILKNIDYENGYSLYVWHFLSVRVSVCTVHSVPIRWRDGVNMWRRIWTRW